MSKKNQYEVYDDRVLVSPDKAEEKSAGGIIIPDTAKEKPASGTVVAVGPGKYEKGNLVPVAQKVDDHILYGRYAGTEVQLDGKTYLLIRSSDCMMKVPKN